MYEFWDCEDNLWTPPVVSEEEMDRLAKEASKVGITEGYYLAIFRTEPYIDSFLFHFQSVAGLKSVSKRRFVFREDYKWDYKSEKQFIKGCLKNEEIRCTVTVLDAIFDYYSERYPDWKLKRYYTNPMRMLDHIYSCFRRGTIKEMLYKSGLDELAAAIGDKDEVNVLARKPSELYDGISIRTLRALNCHDGAVLLNSEKYRYFVKELQRGFPNMFDSALNNAQCKYIKFLIDGDLTVGEAGRLFASRRKDLMMMWGDSQYGLFLCTEKNKQDNDRTIEMILEIDPIYGSLLKDREEFEPFSGGNKFNQIREYLLYARQEMDEKIRRANRKRNPDWQERDKGYVVRFPQTINDFCRESVYQSNCLLAYAYAFMENDTTILFMRKVDDFNTPFITIEVYQNELKQAYHRFNQDCTKEEAEWILEYCDRHGIGRGYFKFNCEQDDLF